MATSTTHFLVIGSTGAIGTLFCRAAVKAGHKLTLLVRSPTKVPGDLRDDDLVELVEGELYDKDARDSALRTGATVLVSFAGPPMQRKEEKNSLAEGYKLILEDAPNYSIDRALILSTPTYRCNDDKSSLFWDFAFYMIKHVYPWTYREVIGTGDCVTSQSESLKWTLYRVGALTDGEEKPVEITFVGSGKDRTSISRASVAKWVLDESTECNWVHRVPYICN